MGQTLVGSGTRVLAVWLVIAAALVILSVVLVIVESEWQWILLAFVIIAFGSLSLRRWRAKRTISG